MNDYSSKAFFEHYCDKKLNGYTFHSPIPGMRLTQLSMMFFKKYLRSLST